MPRDYGEIMCEAINTIVQESLKGLEYDITKNCTIVNIDDRKFGKYKVSDGSLTFFAYSPESAIYELDETVLVTIPQGDLNKQATIINRLANPLTNSINYMRPFDTLLKGTGNICYNLPSSKGIIANHNNKGSLSLICSIDKEYFGFTKLGLSGDFKTLISRMNVVEGAYGIKLMLYGTRDNKDSVMDLTFSSYDMFGNAYEFISYYNQQMVFTIPKYLNAISKIDVYLYQDGNFKDGNGVKIPDSGFNNILVKNLELYLGYEADRSIEERVEIAAPELTYQDASEKLIYLRWFHKVNENTIEPITFDYWDSQKYEIRWYRYEVGCNEADTDEYGGKSWKWINRNEPSLKHSDYPFVYLFNPDVKKPTEKFKVVTFVHDHPLFNNPAHIVTTNFESNVLEFTNIDEDTKGGTTYISDITDDLSLYFEDNSEGNYFLYDQNGFLINKQQIGQTYSRNLSVRYKNAEINQDSPIFNNIKSITWEVPENDGTTTMILYNRDGTKVFQSPATQLIKGINSANISNQTWKLNTNTSFALKSGSETIAQIPIPADDHSNYKDEKYLYLYQDIDNAEVGVYNFEAKVQVFNSGDEDVKKESAKVCLMVFTSNDGVSWSNPSVKTFTVSCETVATLKSSFKITKEHTKLRVAIGYLKNQSYNKKPTDSYYNFLVYGNINNTGSLGRTLLFESDSNFYTNTTYPIENASGKKTLDTKFTYAISDTWVSTKGNNLIRCIVNIDDTLYPLSETLRFGPKGSNGTHNTFLLEFLDGKNALEAKKNETLRVRAVLINTNGQEIFFDETEAKKIKWSIINENTSHMSLAGTQNLTTNINTITCKVDTLPTNNYAILCANYKYGNGPTLYTYIPIPIKLSTCAGMTGATQIIYNHQGLPSYSNVPYCAYLINGTEDKDWSLSQERNTPNPVQLKDSSAAATMGKALIATPLFCKGTGNGPIYDKICVHSSTWSQPILIMQSQYDFAMLNEWDGSLTIDEENGIILATMLGAGKKNNDNTFSGVLMGDVQGGTGLNNTETMTGVYGFRNGVMTYALRENGTAFFGAAGKGRIEFNGENGIISSAGWKQNGNNEWYLEAPFRSGTLMDLDDAMLIMQSNANYFKFNANNQGLLEMKCSGANIKLTDKNGTPGLSAYIDTTAQGIISEVRRAPSYYGTSSTDSSWSKSGETWSENNNNRIKIVTLTNFNEYYESEDRSIDALSPDDVFKNGVTLGVTFTKAQLIKEIVTYGEKNLSPSVARTGSELKLRIVFNGTNYDYNIYLGGKVSSTNPFGWTANTIVYFTFVKSGNSGYWKVTDSGTYSKITQTADMIRTEVSSVSGVLNSSITQTADSIRAEVNRSATYEATCGTNAGTAVKTITFNAGNKYPDVFARGCTILVKFSKGNTVTSSALRFSINNKSYEVVNPSAYETDEILPFEFNGSKWVMTSLSNSSITQTADAIKMEVYNQGGYACEYQSFNGNSSSYDLYNVKIVKPTGSMTTNTILSAGTTIAVTFTEATKNPKKNMRLSVYLSTSNTYTTEKPVYFLGKAISTTNPFSWTQGALVYFSYNGTRWNVVDPGSYSKITQTATSITSTIKNEYDPKFSTIQQTINGISATVASGANYNVTCYEAKNTQNKYLRFNNADIEVLYDTTNKKWLIKSGCVIGVKFVNGNTVTSSNCKFILSNSSTGQASSAYSIVTPNIASTNITSGVNVIECGQNEVLYFMFNGSNFQPINVGISTFEQTATKISAKVSNDIGNQYAILSATPEGIVSSVFDNEKFTTVQQTANNASAEVGNKLNANGEGTRFGWNISVNRGFQIYRKNASGTQNVFTVDTSGNGIFAGSLSAVSGTFTELTAGSFVVNGSSYTTTLNANYINLSAQWLDKSGRTVAGQVFIGSPNALEQYWEDITVLAKPIKQHSTNHVGGYVSYGNMGLEGRPWDLMYARNFLQDSAKDLKENIMTYNIEQAYEELKYLPIYTYNYKSGNEKTQMLKLGTIIDFMPNEVMATRSSSNCVYDRDNLVFWSIAAAQVMQIKIEALQNKIEILESLLNDKE